MDRVRSLPIKVQLSPQQYRDIADGKLTWFITSDPNICDDARLQLIAPFGGGDRDLFATVIGMRDIDVSRAEVRFLLDEQPRRTSDDGWHPMPVGNRTYLVEYARMINPAQDPVTETRTAEFIGGMWCVHGIEGSVDVMRWRSIEP